MFPVPSGATNAAAQQYGEVKQSQDDKLHEQDHPEQAQAEENTKLASRGEAPKANSEGGEAKGDKGENDAKKEADVGTKEVLKAVHSSFMTHI